MGKCIRCGKPCPDGRNMCDDCMAWFKERTGNTGAAGSAGSAGSAGRKAGGISQPVQTEPDRKPERTVPPSGSQNVSGSGKGGGKKPFVLIFILVLIAAVIVAAVLLRKKSPAPEPDLPAVQTQEYAEPEPEPEQKSEPEPVQTEAQDKDDAEEIITETAAENLQETDTESGEEPSETQPMTEEMTAEPEPDTEPMTEEELTFEDIPDVPTVGAEYISSCEASSALAEYNMVHSAERVCDGSMAKAWCEGASGQGYGETLTIFFSEECEVSGFIIYNGYQKDEKRFYNNSRPAQLTISFSDGESQLIDLEDGMGAQTVHLDTSHISDSISFTIEEVYPGSKFEDTLISEIILF